MCPGGNKPSGTVSNNKFLTCPTAPAIFANPAVKGCADGVTMTGNQIDGGLVVVDQPQLSFNPPSPDSPDPAPVIPVIVFCTTPNATLRCVHGGQSFFLLLTCCCASSTIVFLPHSPVEVRSWWPTILSPTLMISHPTHHYQHTPPPPPHHQHHRLYSLVRSLIRSPRATVRRITCFQPYTLTITRSLTTCDRYTTDGSRPSETSPIFPANGLKLVWPGPNIAVNVRGFKDGFIPSVTNGVIVERRRYISRVTSTVRGSFDTLTQVCSTSHQYLLTWVDAVIVVTLSTDTFSFIHNEKIRIHLLFIRSLCCMSLKRH